MHEYFSFHFGSVNTSRLDLLHNINKYHVTRFSDWQQEIEFWLVKLQKEDMEKYDKF